MATGPDTSNPEKKSKRRFVITLGVYLAGIATGIYLDTKPYISSLWKSTVTEAVDSGQWERIGGCEGPNGKKALVYRNTLGVGLTRMIVIDEYLKVGAQPVRTPYHPSWWFEGNAHFDARIIKIACDKINPKP